MEVESVPYIFGSFSRRKSNHNYLKSQSKNSNSENNNCCNANLLKNVDKREIKGRHLYSKSQSETSNLEESSKQIIDRSQRSKSCNITLKTQEDKTLLPVVCPICNHVFLEPRVLECLHSFCTRCLQNLLEKSRKKSEVWTKENSVLNEDSCHEDVNCIICPVCQQRTLLSRYGILGLPPNYIIQHRLILATINDENTKLLCDLCSCDVTAIYRCTDCMANLCEICKEIHQRHQVTCAHELLRLSDVRREGRMRIHRQIMCQIHPEYELLAYCISCSQTVCLLCLKFHQSSQHNCQPCSVVAAGQSNRLRRLLGTVRFSAVRDSSLQRRLTSIRHLIEKRCKCVQSQVENFIEEYKKAIENHRLKLLKEIDSIRISYLDQINCFEDDLSTRLEKSSTTINFTQNLLDEGSEVEILTFVNNLHKTLESLEQPLVLSEDIKCLLKQIEKHKNLDDDGLVDFIPTKQSDELNFSDSTNESNNKEYNTSKLGTDSDKNLSNTVEVKENTNIKKLNWKQSFLRKKLNAFERKNDTNSKSYSGIFNLKNCLEKNQDLSITQSIISTSSNSCKSLYSDLKLSDQSLATNESIILEFSPLNSVNCAENVFPVIFGQIQRLYFPVSENGNCCSASNPHLGGVPLRKSKIYCEKISESKTSTRNSDCNKKVYEITL